MQPINNVFIHNMTNNLQFVFIGLGAVEREKLKKMKEAHGIVEAPKKIIRKKKAKGPNPKSCLKKKKKVPQKSQ